MLITTEKDDSFVTVSIEDAFKILGVIYKEDKNCYVDISTNVFNFDKDNNKKLDISAKFYLNGDELKLNFLPKSKTKP